MDYLCDISRLGDLDCYLQTTKISESNCDHDMKTMRQLFDVTCCCVLCLKSREYTNQTIRHIGSL